FSWGARISLDQLLRRPLDADEGARHEIAPVGREVERLAHGRLAGVGDDRAVQEEAQAAMDAAAQGEVPLEKFPRSPIAHSHAEAVAEVILGVPRDVDAVAAAIGAREVFGRDLPRASVRRLAHGSLLLVR